MTADGLAFVQWFSVYIWSFFTSWKIPGTGMTPAHWLFFILLVSILVPIVKDWIKKELSS